MLTVLMDEEINGVDWIGRPSPVECRKWGDRDPGFDHTFNCWVDPEQPGQEAWPRYNSQGALPTNVIMDAGMRVVYADGGYSESTIRTVLSRVVPPDTCLH